MKKSNGILVLLVLASLVLASCATPAAQAPEGGAAMEGLPDLGGRTVTVAVENAYPPFNYLDETTNEP
jgi:polar amino acid transport system substrate-binding protein